MGTDGWRFVENVTKPSRFGRAASFFSFNLILRRCVPILRRAFGAAHAILE